MKGADAIVRARLRGTHPGLVFVDLDGDAMPGFRFWDDPDSITAVSAHVLVEPADNVPTLDLRCMHRLAVMVEGSDPERVAEVVQACDRAGAVRVIGAVFQRNEFGEPKCSRLFGIEGGTPWQE